MIKNYKMFIDNNWIDSQNGENINVINPFNEEIIAQIPLGTREDAANALEISEKAQKKWAALPAQMRAEFIKKLASELKKEKVRFALLLTEEQGKTYKEALGEVDAAVLFFNYAAESARRIEGEIRTSEMKKEQVWIQRVPYGVTVGLATWNFPLALAARKLGNSLVCGNTMVLMPPLDTPLAILELGKLIEKVGFPSGVVNIITGLGGVVGDELVRNQRTKMVSLTGSTEIGKILYKSASENLAVLSLELGGKAPFIVMDDVDIDKVVHIAVLSAFENGGQVCTCNERMYIHEKIYDEFMDRFIAKVKELKVGDPMNENTDIGPKVNGREVEKLVMLVEGAKKEGAKIELGGNKLTEGIYSKGYWFQPTVITNVTNDMEIVQEETFGPIVAAMKVKDFDEALKYANDSKYGLSAYLFTNDVRKIMRASDELEFGEVYVNRRNGELVNAFHNGFKQSGIGGEDGKHGLQGYLQKKTIYMNYNE
ncbi:aldehyde dehydrogenase family protein [Clostridium sp. DL1XJH146]